MELDHSSPRPPGTTGGGHFRAATEANTIVLSGYLEKEAKGTLGCTVGKKWQRRWVEVLEGAVLAYTTKGPVGSPLPPPTLRP